MSSGNALPGSTGATAETTTSQVKGLALSSSMSLAPEDPNPVKTRVVSLRIGPNRG
ncbi:MAG: hypothetical protein ACR2LJ_03535 [Acidimicrobiales bacterium]